MKPFLYYIGLSCLVLAHTQLVQSGTCYTMCTRGSPDIYTLSPWACGPRASGVYIRQTTRAHSITIKYSPSFVFMASPPSSK